jgi:prepilin-type N-terminal cleavage/methylation domain-containing protein
MKSIDCTQGAKRVGRITARLRAGARDQAGFTLIELLVVIIIIAVLATIAIPTFVGQRTHAQDAAAYSLVRNALTALQGAFADTGDYTRVTAADLSSIEPGIDWVENDLRPKVA